MEGDLYDLANDCMGHAGHWGTSLMMYFRPELVDMEEIEGEDLASEEGRKEGGIYGRGPRKQHLANLVGRSLTGC